MLDTLAFVGAGLLGTSLGLAAKQRRVARRVLGVAPLGRSTASLQRAGELGACDEWWSGFDHRLAAADLVVLCAPVRSIPRLAADLMPFLGPHALVTDVGSAKSALVAAAARWTGNDPRFVGSHPMAGSERRGPEAASAELFAGRPCFVTPPDGRPNAAAERVAAFWRGLGMRVSYKTPAEHDALVARISHVPHVAAAALARAAEDADLPHVGQGFRDTTRVAGGGPDLWTEILGDNAAPVAAGLRALAAELAACAAALDRGDAAFVEQWLADAKRKRDLVGSGIDDPAGLPGR